MERLGTADKRSRPPPRIMSAADGFGSLRRVGSRRQEKGSPTLGSTQHIGGEAGFMNSVFADSPGVPRAVKAK